MGARRVLEPANGWLVVTATFGLLALLQFWVASVFWVASAERERSVAAAIGAGFAAVGALALVAHLARQSRLVQSLPSWLGELVRITIGTTMVAFAIWFAAILGLAGETTECAGQACGDYGRGLLDGIHWVSAVLMAVAGLNLFRRAPHQRAGTTTPSR